jgi:hypothetical protein
MDIMIDDVNYKCKISHQLEQQLMKGTTLDPADAPARNNPAPYRHSDFFPPQQTFFDGPSIGRRQSSLPPPIPFQSMHIPPPVSIPRYGSFSDPTATVTSSYGRSPPFLSSRSADNSEYDNCIPQPAPHSMGFANRSTSSYHQLPPSFHNRSLVTQNNSNNSSNNSINPSSVGSLLDGVKDISLNCVSVDSTVGSYSSLPLASSRTNTPPPSAARNNPNNCSSNSLFSFSVYSQATTSASESSFVSDNGVISRTLSAAGRSSVSPAPSAPLPFVHLIHSFPEEKKSLHY